MSCKDKVYFAVMPKTFRYKKIRSKWKFSILIIVSDKPMRFNKIKQLCSPISSNSLARCLRQMEKDELIIKKESTHLTYQTTPVGAKISKLLSQINDLLQTLD